MEQQVLLNPDRGCKAPQASQAVIPKYCQPAQPDVPQKVPPTLWNGVCCLAVLQSLLSESVPENWWERRNIAFSNEECSCNRHKANGEV